ncbi:MAG: cytoplasmic protein [Deltaproteobacteria bacterium]|nr:cytoplasmic protein [Deltaproteobacteria bacterium]
MLKNEMVAKNPLRGLDQSREGGLAPGQMGLIAARAGTGKTAFLIQVALDSIFRGSPVLHVSIGETVSHVKAWYEEIYRDLAQGYDLEKAREVWEETERGRLILTFRVQAFSVDKLEERLNDLTEQGIFQPRVVLVDGLDLSTDLQSTVEALGHFARSRGLKVWVACRTHREMGDLAALVAPYEDLFQVAVGLEPRGESTELLVLKNPAGPGGRTPIALDTRTLLLVSK